MAKSVSTLRAEVARAQRLANQKMARTRAATGANVKGSQFDPTRDPAKVARYNSKQLRTYLAQLDEFRSRNVQFVSGARGAPIPKHLATRFQNVQDSYNRVSAREFASVEGVRLPGGGTIGERESLFMPDQRAAGGRAANRPRGKFTINVSGVTSVDALEKLEAEMRSRMSGTTRARKLKGQRFQLAEMLERVGLGDEISRINELSDEQFNTVWSYTDFPETVSTRYESVKHMTTHEEAASLEDFRSEIVGVFEWAKRIK